MSLDDTTVKYDIRIEATMALQNLKNISQSAGTVREKIDLATQAVTKFAKETGLRADTVAGIFRQIDSAFTQSAKDSSIFGQNGSKAWSDVGKAAQQGGGLLSRSFHVANIAAGVLISSLVGEGIQAVREFFGSAIKQAKELEDSLYRLASAERSLSLQGIDISMKGLQEGIASIKKQLPIFSKEEISRTVGLLASSTKQLGFNEKQILDLTSAIGILNVRSIANEDITTTAQHILSSLLTDNAKGVSSLGVAFGEVNLQAMGMKLGFLEAGEAASNLTNNEKGLAKLAIIMESANGDLATFNEYLDSNSAKIQINQAAWEDLKITVGQVFLPLIPHLTAFFEFLSNSFNGLKVVLIETAVLIDNIITRAKSAQAVIRGDMSQAEYDETVSNAPTEKRRELVNQFFPEGLPANIGQGWKNLYEPLIKIQKETNTALINEQEQSQSKQEESLKKHGEKIKEATQDAADKRLDIERDYQRKLEDIRSDYRNKLADIARSTEQKQEDALRDYNQKVEDINRDTNNSIAEAQEDARQKDIEREQQYLQRLKELREGFLFDLEDALRSRDARQVLRLVRQYALDKKNLEEKHKLDQQQSQVDLKNKIEDLERDRQLKLEAARRDYEEKLVEIKIGEQRAREEASLWLRRQLEDANIWHRRQLQENREYLQRRLRDIAEALAQELQMNNAAAQSLIGLWSGAMSTINGNIISTNLGGGQTATQVVGSGAVSISGGNWNQPGIGSGLFNPYDVRSLGQGMAEGGTLLATRPTRFIAGENGPEKIDVTPLSGRGNNVGRLFGDRSAMGGMGGAIKLEMLLSPDLEARVLDNSLESVSVILQRVINSK